MAKLPYRPVKTDAYTLLAGWNQGPVDDMLFSSDQEAQDCLARMISTGVVPAGPAPYGATLIDDQYAFGPVVYGRDGRKIWCIVFKKDNVQYDEPVGRILWMEGNYPSAKLYANPDSSGIDIKWG